METKNLIHAEFNHTRDWSRFDNSITAAGTNGCACKHRAAVKKSWIMVDWELHPRQGELDSPRPDMVWVVSGDVTRISCWVPAKWIGSILRDNSCFIPLSPLTTQTPQCTALHRSSSHGVDLSHLVPIVLLHKSGAVCAYLSVDLAARDLINWHSIKSER